MKNKPDARLVSDVESREMDRISDRALVAFRRFANRIPMGPEVPAGLEREAIDGETLFIAINSILIHALRDTDGDIKDYDTFALNCFHQTGKAIGSMLGQQPDDIVLDGFKMLLKGFDAGVASVRNIQPPKAV